MPSTLHPAPNCRAPLATKYNTGNVAVEATTLTLPVTLPRPELDEVKMSTLLDMYPDLAGIPAEYIRDRMPLSTPPHLEITMNDIVSAACLTHMLAIYSDASLALGQKRQIGLYPCHDLVMGIYCTRLPKLPLSQPDAAYSHATIPVVPICLPPPGTFALLHAYLYTQNPGTLALLTPPQESGLLQLVAHATKVHGLWRNARALGVIAPLLYDVVEESWAKTLTAMRACS
ncbi:hypothetical protein B0H14DRAFT_3641385 [Mycena olivaceomarginata]|nr:hypothetical protein B0H14DRAFT_3641385 [Mycena olivaceomarginata]